MEPNWAILLMLCIFLSILMSVAYSVTRNFLKFWSKPGKPKLTLIQGGKKERKWNGHIQDNKPD